MNVAGFPPLSLFSEPQPQPRQPQQPQPLAVTPQTLPGAGVCYMAADGVARRLVQDHVGTSYLAGLPGQPPAPLVPVGEVEARVLQWQANLGATGLRGPAPF